MHDHASEVIAASASRTSDEMISEMSKLYKLFADPTRLRIMALLLDGRLCVNAICEILGMAQSAVSHQLRTLKDNRLVGCERQGKTVFYFLMDDHVSKIISQGREHVSEK